MREQKKLIQTAAVLIPVALFLLCCSPESVDRGRPGNTGISQTYSQGQFTLSQEITASEITVADQIEIILETSAPENVRVDYPQYQTSLGDFTLADVRAGPPRLTGTGDYARIVQATVYIVEPYLPGTYSLPPMTVAFRYKDENTEPARLMTDDRLITVRSLLPGNGGPEDIKDIRGPVSLPPNTGFRVILAALLVLLALSAAAGFFYWRKITDSREKPEIRLPPHQTAIQELDRLLTENLIAQGKLKLFHLRISDILRRYIENRFGLRAPEQTTEEFLSTLSGTALDEKSNIGLNRNLLADFLNHCDLVKFARHQATAAECEKTISLCREFIEKTKREIEN